MGVSIITPAYNSEKYLAVTIKSVLAQTIQEWELVVVNDGSTDQTGQIAEDFASLDNRIRVVHQANAGIAGARNRGFAEANGDYEYCLFLDNDDVLEPDALDTLWQTLQEDQSAVAAHGLARFIDSDGNPIALAGNYLHPSRRHGIRGKRLQLWPHSAPTTFEVLAYGTCLMTTGIIMLRRAPKVIVGDFDPKVQPADDWDMWLRLSRLGHIAFVNKAVLAYRLHEKNASRNIQLMRSRGYSIWEKMFKSAELNEYEKKIILIGYRYHELRAAYYRFRYAARSLSQGKRGDSFKHIQVAMKHILSSLKGLSRT